jgi:PPOX class probable F420-dependent enzyme
VAGDLVDTSTDFGARVEQRLRDDIIVWLVTVAADGTPQPNPVWFLWDGQTALIYSIAAQAKLKNLERNPNSALHLDSRDGGDDIVILTGTAAVDPTAIAVDRNQAYVDKYRAEIKRIGFASARKMAEKYTVPIRFTPKKVRGF